MNTAKISVFVTGGTGYVGGSILARLLAPSYKQKLNITALVRSKEKAQIFETKFGINTIVGTLEDDNILEEAAYNAHIVINSANCDHLKSARAILRGLKRRHETTGDVPILLHTSGTATFLYDDRGAAPTGEVYDDLNAQQIETLSPEALHRHVDLEVVAADKEGYVKTYIVLPSTIFGLASNVLVDAGLAHNASIALPMHITAALKRGTVGMVGKGLSIWNCVHTDDNTDAYMVLFNAILANRDDMGHGRNGYYIVENGEFTSYELAKALGEVLHQQGKIKSSEPTTYSEDELIKYYGSLELAYILGGTARGHANRFRALGWEPRKSVQDLFASIAAEVNNAKA
ncbi:NAD(P)-binding protein [Abortiporus biennis]|nr:NAD(P)-binding protein [Abortiporus biennis]